MPVFSVNTSLRWNHACGPGHFLHEFKWIRTAHPTVLLYMAIMPWWWHRHFMAWRLSGEWSFVPALYTMIYKAYFSCRTGRAPLHASMNVSWKHVNIILFLFNVLQWFFFSDSGIKNNRHSSQTRVAVLDQESSWRTRWLTLIMLMASRIIHLAFESSLRLDSTRVRVRACVCVSASVSVSVRKYWYGKKHAFSQVYLRPFKRVSSCIAKHVLQQ